MTLHRPRMHSGAITAFKVDGLANGPHTLKLEVINTNGSYIVVDAFDVHP